MALQLNEIVSQYELNLTDSYQKIDNIIIKNGIVDFDLLVFVSEAARRGNVQPITKEHFTLQFSWLKLMEGDDLIEKLYFYLKKLDQKYNKAKTV